MSKRINELIVNLKKELEVEYGKDFNNFYLVNSNNIEKEKWEGIIATNTKGKKCVEYYTIKEKKIVKEEKTIY